MHCRHEFPEGSRLCSRCGALVVPPRAQLAHVAEARAILERAAEDHPMPSADDAVA